MKSSLHEALLGKNAKGEEIKLSGDWEKGAIRASIYAQNLGQIGAHVGSYSLAVGDVALI
jgi:hypothetical protein